MGNDRGPFGRVRDRLACRGSLFKCSLVAFFLGNYQRFARLALSTH